MNEPHRVYSSVHVLIGVPGSGKSTHARTYGEDWVRVNRDDIRAMISGGHLDEEGCLTYSPKIEGLVTKIHNQILVEALRKGKNVVVDNMNLRGAYRQDIRDICERQGSVSYQEVVFNTPLDVCLARNEARGVRLERKVPPRVIRRLHAQFQGFLGGYKPGITMGYSQLFERRSPPTVEHVPGAPMAIICDLDGTLCLHNGRDPYDAAKCGDDLPNKAVLDTLWAMRNSGFKIIYLSGRKEMWRPETKAFFDKHGPPAGELFMRRTNDDRNDAIVKEELFNEHVRGKYNVLYVLDDRDRVVHKWRDMGLTCFQVAPGDF